MKRKVLTIVFGAIAGIVFILIWLHFVDLRTIVESLRNLQLIFILIALSFYLSAYFVRSLRWRLLLMRVQPLSRTRAFLFMMAGNFTNYLIPVRAGELMRCYFIKKLHGTRMSLTLPSVFVDKLFDSTGILIVLLLIPLLSVNLPPVLQVLLLTILIILLCGCLIIFLAICKGDRVIRFLKRFLFFIPARSETKLEETITLFVEGLAVFKAQKKLILPVVLLSVTAILLDSFFFYSLFLAFQVQINYFYVLLGYTLIYLSYIIPHPPAQLGSNELMMMLIFAAGFGLHSDTAGAIMLLSHILTGMVIVTMGLFAYSYSGVQLLTIINKGDDLNE